MSKTTATAAKQKLIIKGGKPLQGEVKISGAKNATTKLMVASLLTEQPVVLYNVPHIGDVRITKEICEQVGSQIELENHTLRLHTPEITNTVVKKLSKKNRISILALAPLLHRTGEVEVPLVGGDRVGPRPVNFHIQALEKMGAEITQKDNSYHAQVDRLHGASIRLDYPSVGATENIILAAVLAEGRTKINNAAVEPEITDLVKMLQRMGAIIEFRANRKIIIDGVESLHGVSYPVMPDRLEAASYGCLAIATGGNILARGAEQNDMITFLNTIRRIGADYHIDEHGITFKRNGAHLKGIELETDVWPGFSTDWQQPLMVVLTQASSGSVIHETVYEDRFGYTETLNKMGANIALFEKCLGEIDCRFKGENYKHSAVINGPTSLRGTKIEVPDIRAGMAHVIAALTAEGESEITGLSHLLRGYDNLLDKLRAVGAEFDLIED